MNNQKNKQTAFKQNKQVNKKNERWFAVFL